VALHLLLGYGAVFRELEPMGRSGAMRLSSAVAILLAVILCAGLTTLLFARDDDPEPRERRPAPVAATVYELLDGYINERHFLGIVQAGTRTSIGFEVPGSIADLTIREGDRVQAGAILAELDTRTLDAQHDAAAATERQLAAEQELARARMRRQEPLLESGAISDQRFDETRLREKAIRARRSAARARLTELQIALEKSVLRAPYAARIGARLVDEGAVVQPGQPVLTLIAVEQREARVGVAVEQARALRLGEHYRLQLGGREVSAPLRAILPEVARLSMTTTAIFDLPADVDALDGEPLSMSLPRTVDERGGWLPLSALLEGERGVWTVLALDRASDGLRTRREIVEVLHVRGDFAYVHGTLRDGERVVADGVHRIAPGTRVQVVDS